MIWCGCVQLPDYRSAAARAAKASAKVVATAGPDLYAESTGVFPVAPVVGAATGAATGVVATPLLRSVKASASIVNEPEVTPPTVNVKERSPASTFAFTSSSRAEAS